MLAVASCRSKPGTKLSRQFGTGHGWPDLGCSDLLQTLAPLPEDLLPGIAILSSAIYSENVGFVSLQENLRKELRQRIRDRKLTGLDLARRTGFTQAHVSNFLNCKRGLKLGALDRVLRAVGLTVHDLLDPRGFERSTADSVESKTDYADVPLVDRKVAASRRVIVPEKAQRCLKFPRAFLNRLRPALVTPARKSWTRFVAIRVDADGVAAMAPLIAPGAHLLLDRHYNSLEPYRKGERNIYAVYKPRGVAVRYVGLVGDTLVLRPHSVESAVELLPLRSGTYGEMIIGRVAQIRLET